MKSTKLLVCLPVIAGLLALLFVPGLTHADDLELVNPIDANSPAELIATVIKTLLAFLGALATLMFIYGGFMMITSGGNPEAVQKGQKTVVWAIIGLVVVLSSYGIMEFVFNTLVTGSPV